MVRGKWHEPFLIKSISAFKVKYECEGGGVGWECRMSVVECRMQPHHYSRTIISNKLSVLPLFQDCDCCKSEMCAQVS